MESVFTFEITKSFVWKINELKSHIYQETLKELGNLVYIYGLHRKFNHVRTTATIWIVLFFFEFIIVRVMCVKKFLGKNQRH